MTDKTELRHKAQTRRATLANPGHGVALATAAPSRVWGKSTGGVAGYWPFRDEADPRPLMAALAKQGHLLALPVILGKNQPLRFHRWQDGDVMATHRFGVSEPLPTAPILIPDILLVPLLAFDAQGYRLGYGGGFYDRTLALLRAQKPVTAIGIAYAGQAVEAVPHEAHDQKLDGVLTEAGLRRF